MTARITCRNRRASPGPNGPRWKRVATALSKGELSGIDPGETLAFSVRRFAGGSRPPLAAVRDFDDPPAETADRLRRAAADDADPLLQGGGDPVDVVARAVAEGRAADVGYRNACLAAHLRLERRVGRVAG